MQSLANSLANVTKKKTTAASVQKKLYLSEAQKNGVVVTRYIIWEVAQIVHPSSYM